MVRKLSAIGTGVAVVALVAGCGEASESDNAKPGVQVRLRLRDRLLLPARCCQRKPSPTRSASPAGDPKKKRRSAALPVVPTCGQTAGRRD